MMGKRVEAAVSTPVYASDPALPRRPQDSVPTPPATALVGRDFHPYVFVTFIPAHSRSWWKK
jgi:hypothetical protein